MAFCLSSLPHLSLCLTLTPLFLFVAVIPPPPSLSPSSMTQHPPIFHLYLCRPLLFPVSPPLLCHFLLASFSHLTKHFHIEFSFTVKHHYANFSHL